jgi:mono/diheme cytochrome c family protein
MALMHRLLLVTALLVSLSCGQGTASTAEVADLGATKGEELFNANCALCHGRKGDLGMNGAKDLTISPLTRAEMIAMVSNGKGAMMPYKNVLTPKQIETVVDHVRTLRKAG